MCLCNKKSHTAKLESVIKPCLKIVANLLCGGKQAVDKVEQIALSNDTITAQSAMIAEDIKLRLIVKLIEAPCLALQFDETTCIKNDGQLIVYCRFSDESFKKIVEHFLFCLLVGLQSTGEFMFSKLDKFFQNKNISWKKCVAVTTDGAAVIIGKSKGVTAFIKQRSPDCILHCEALQEIESKFL